jgi:hypothetical protein
MLEPGLATERMTMTRWNCPGGPGIRVLRPMLAAAVLTLATAACAHSTPAPASTTAQEAEAMDAPESRPADRLTYSPEEIGQRFLKLIESLESREDLTLERVNEVMGARIVVEPDAVLAGAGSDDLGGGWRYVLMFVPKSGSRLNGVDLSFVNDDPEADIAPACGLDFYATHDALVAMGFVDSPRYGEIGQLRAWHYTKFKKTDGSVDMTISILPQNPEPYGNTRLCVRSIGTLN